jgi:mono/diheme cytochrome c family protein
MRTLLKIVLGLVGVLAVIVALAVAFAEFGSERKLNRMVVLSVLPVSAASDEAALTRGKYLYLSRGCAECHGADGAGKVVIDLGGLYVKAPDITKGPGGVVQHFTDLDWVKVIRHCVKPDGKPLLIMPSEDYARLTDADLAALVGYVRSLPAKPGEAASFRIPLLVRFLYAAGFIKDAAEKIDHTRPPEQPPASGNIIARGAYVASACTGCHNEALSGGTIPGGPPDWPPAANLTPAEGSALARYSSAEAFATMFRSGKRPDGSAVSTVMPFGMLKELSADDVAALYAYLKTLPPKRLGEKG